MVNKTIKLVEVTGSTGLDPTEAIVKSYFNSGKVLTTITSRDADSLWGKDRGLGGTYFKWNPSRRSTNRKVTPITLVRKGVSSNVKLHELGHSKISTTRIETEGKGGRENPKTFIQEELEAEAFVSESKKRHLSWNQVVNVGLRTSALYKSSPKSIVRLLSNSLSNLSYARPNTLVRESLVKAITERKYFEKG